MLFTNDGTRSSSLLSVKQETGQPLVYVDPTDVLYIKYMFEFISKLSQVIYNQCNNQTCRVFLKPTVFMADVLSLHCIQSSLI